TNYNFGSIRYESRKVFVTAFYFPSRYECDVSFGLFDDKSQSYNIGDLTGSADDFDFSPNYTFEKLSQAEILERNISWFASLLQRYGSDYLKGDVRAYKKLEERSNRRSKEYTQDLTNKQLRNKAASAWEQKDFAVVVESYKSMKKFLSAAEKKKLEYSEKMLNKND
ncbi:MAG TPA: hypothetical protein VGB68_06065, partial [Pyrinomonadaceae bacterium]